MTPGTLDPDSTEALVDRANKARERLLESVDALDRKRHQLVKPVLAVERTLEAVADRRLRPKLVVSGALLVSGLLAAVALKRRRDRRTPLLQLLQPRRSFFRELLWQAGLGLAAVTALEAGKRTVHALLDGPHAPPSPNPGRRLTP